MYVPSHFGSARQAGLRRALRQYQALILDLQSYFERIEVVLPPDYDGDENVTFRNVLDNEVPRARLKVDGKVVAKSKVMAAVHEIDEQVIEVKAENIDPIKRQLRKLGEVI